MITIQAVLQGDESLQVTLGQLADGGQRRAMRSALAVGNTIFRNAIKREIPNAITHGHDNAGFRNAIGSRFISSRKNGITTSKTGINVGKKKRSMTRGAVQNRLRRRAIKLGLWKEGTKVNPHYHLLALGTAMRRTHFSAGRGRIKQGDFVPRATASVASACGVAMEQKLRERIYAEALKGR